MTLPSAFPAPGASDEPRLVYRPRMPVVAVSAIVAIALATLAGAGIAVAVGSLLVGDTTVATVAMLEVILVVPFALLLWRQSRLCLEADATGIRVTNYFSTFRVPWRSVQRFEAPSDSVGIRAILRDGTSLKASAVQKPRVTAWLHAPSHADAAVRELNKWLFRLRYETTARRLSQPARGPQAERDHGDDDRRDGQAVPHEGREGVPSQVPEQEPDREEAADGGGDRAGDEGSGHPGRESVPG
jgi:hypothetical protein